MKAVVSRVTQARVTVGHDIVGQITEPGLLVLLGITHEDNHRSAENMARKLYELRILRDEKSCADTGAPLLVVSQFTLYGDTKKGRRPSWQAAAPAEQAHGLVSAVITALKQRGATVATGEFQAMMAVESVNDGPFTVLIEV